MAHKKAVVRDNRCTYIGYFFAMPVGVRAAFLRKDTDWLRCRSSKSVGFSKEQFHVTRN